MVTITVILALVSAGPNTLALRPGSSVWDVAVGDINADGRSDILTLCCDKDSYPLQKFIAVFLADERNSYASAPSFTVPLASSIGCAFLAEVDGKPPAEIVAGDVEGCTVFRWQGDRVEEVLKSSFVSLLPGGCKEPVFLKDAAKDLDGDGVDEWLIPASSGYQVRTAETFRCTVPCDVISQIHGGESLRIMYRLPSHHAFVIAGEPQKGLAFLSDEFADFFHGDNWREHQRFKIPMNLEEKWEASAQMADIDGNGLPDLVVTQTKGTINLQVLTHIYLAAGPFTYPDTPTAVLEAKDAIASPLLEDVNGDGKRDVLIVKIPFGIRTFISFFIRRKLGVEVDVHLFTGRGFAVKPDFSETISLDAPEGREKVAYAMADFSGDGRLDVAFGMGAEKLAIHTGTPTQFVSSRPWVELALPTFGVARPENLNGNAAKDLILFHPAGEHQSRVEVVIF